MIRQIESKATLTLVRAPGHALLVDLLTADPGVRKANSQLKFGSVNAMGGGGNGSVLLANGTVGALNHDPVNAAGINTAIARLNTNSAGMFGLAVNNGSANYVIDLSNMKTVRFGTWYATYNLNTGISLLFGFANNGNKYAMGGVDIGGATLNVNAANVFTGNHNLEVLPQHLNIKAAQDYSGTTTLFDNPGGIVQGNTHGSITLVDNGSILNSSGIAVNSGAALTIDNSGTANLASRVSDTAPITLDSTTLTLKGRTTTNSSETVGALSFFAASAVTVNNSVSNTILTAASLTRQTGAQLNVTLTGAGAQFQVASGAPARLTLNATTVNMVAPGYRVGNDFADYAPGSGFTNAVFTSTIADGTNPWTDTSQTSIVDLLGSATLGANNRIAALRLNPSANGKSVANSGVYTNIEIGSGGVMGPVNNVSIDVNPRLIFGPNGTGEAVFYQNTGVVQVNGGVTAAGGLSKNGEGQLTLSKDLSTTLSGTVTLNSGMLSFFGQNNCKLASTTPIVVNGGILYLWDGNQETVDSVTLRGGSISQGGNANPVKLTANSFTAYSGTIGVPLAGVTATLVKNIAHAVSDTVTLSATNTYGGSTTVNGGTLAVTATGLLASNGADKVFIAVDPDGFDAGAISPTLTRAIAANRSYTGYGSSVINGSNTAAAIVMGSNTTATAKSVTMQWRNPVATESNVISSVSRLTGMELASGGHATDAFALQMSYADFSGDTALGASGQLVVGWYSNQTTWVEATLGNSGPGSTVVGNYQGSWSAFALAQGVTEVNLASFLGSWGVDTANNQVWAVLNHNSDFAVLSLPLSVRGSRLEIY